MRIVSNCVFNRTEVNIGKENGGSDAENQGIKLVIS